MQPLNQLLVKTKLAPPNFHISLVQRASILKTLEKVNTKKLTLLCAPAGYGKTSLMAQYYQALEASQHKLAWLSLDKYDADLSQFVIYIIYAIKQIVPDFADSLLSILQAGFSGSENVVSQNLNCAISMLEEPVYVFIDDFHLAETSETCSVLNDVLLNSDYLRCVVSTRHTPQKLSISRLRILDEINEIDQFLLRFSMIESAEFFETRLKTPIKKEQAIQLSEKAEGWAAGMQLASISLRGSENPDSAIKNFTGENRSVGDFLGDEILGNLSTETKTFLLHCSLLPRFNYKLCNYIFENNDSAAIIKELQENHLFIITLDDNDYWFRFHHLFSQYLRKKVCECYPEGIAAIHSKASYWHESQGFYTDAIEHAIESGDHNRAADILDRISADLFYQGNISVLNNYVKSISHNALRNHPSQQMDLIWQWIVTWRFDKARIALSQVRSVLDSYQGKKETSPQEMNFLESKYAHREMSYAFFADSPKEAQSLAEHWLSHHLNEDLSMVSSAKTMLMVAERDQFILDEIPTKVNALHDLHVEANFPYGVVKGDCLCGATLYMQGHINEALRFFERARAAALQLHGEYSPLTAMPNLQIAEILYEKDDIDSAENLIKKYLSMSQGFGFAENIIVGYLTKTRIEFCRNNKKAALRTLEDGRKAALSNGFERLRMTIFTENIRQLLFSDDKKAAFSLARSVGISGGVSRFLPTEHSDRIHLLETIAWVRISVAMTNPNNAIRVLTHWVNHLKVRTCTREAVRCAIILANIHYSHDDPLSGRQYLSYALGEAVKCGFCRLFCDEGPLLASVLKSYKPKDHEIGFTECIQRILAAYKKVKIKTPVNISHDTQTNTDSTQVCLTKREIEILRLCQIDKSNAEIAESLAITEGTVKWYWQNIFSKLGVRRRRQAVIVAVDAGLLIN